MDTPGATSYACMFAEWLAFVKVASLVHQANIASSVITLHPSPCPFLHPHFLLPPPPRSFPPSLTPVYTLASLVIHMQLAGSDWKLAVQGQLAEANQEPQFSTWDDVLNKKKGNSSSNGGNRQAAGAPASGSQAGRPASQSRVLDDALYRSVKTALASEASS